MPSAPSYDSDAKLKEIFAEIDEFRAAHLREQQVLPLSRQLTPEQFSSEVDNGNVSAIARISHAEPSSSDYESSPSEPRTPIEVTKLDYQSLRSQPERGIDWYDTGFGDKVTMQWRKHEIRKAIRVAKYGPKIAETYRRGSTPSPVRRNYHKKCEILEQEAELSLTEDEGRAEGAKSNETKENVTKREMNRPSNELRTHIEDLPPSPERSQRHNRHVVDSNRLVAKRKKVHKCGGPRKRQMDEPKTLDETSGRLVGAELERPTKRCKK